MNDLFPHKSSQNYSQNSTQKTNSASSRAPRGKLVKSYDYHNENGKLLYQVCRYEPKDFKQRQPTPNEKQGWKYSLKGIRRVLYQLPTVLLAVQEGTTIYLVEGEKDADALTQLGLVATTNAGGASKWNDDFTMVLTGAHVVLIPDNDEPGKKHVRQVATALHSRSASVQVLELPGLPEKGDVSDWLIAGGTREQMELLAVEAPHWTSSSPNQPKSTDCRLANRMMTDSGNAERLIDHRGKDLRYVRGLGWRVWNGKFWDAGIESVTRLARETIRALFGIAGDLLQDAETEQDKNHRKELVSRAESLIKHARQSENAPRLNAMVSLAASFEEITVEAAEFDIKAWVVPFANGVWDRGRWRGHQRTDYNERLLPVHYYPNADRSEWEALLERITGGDDALAAMLQDVAGYALSGASSLRLLPWLYGPKGTGKSTFAELLQTVLGMAGKALDWSLVSGERKAEELGRAVRASRAVFLPEAGRKRLDPEILKLLSGSDRLPGRDLYQSTTFSVPPTWALIATSNDAPNVTAYDDALRDRVMALPFVHPLAAGEPLQFTGGRRLEETRRDSFSPLVAGFVAWAVDGLAQVCKTQQIRRAASAEAHTRLFWSDTDPLTPFWSGVEVLLLRQGMSTNALRGAYVSWCDVEGIRKPLLGKAWGQACHAAGLEEYRTKTERRWRLPHGKPWPYGISGGDEGIFGDGMTDSESFSQNLPYEEKTGEVYGKQERIRHSVTKNAFRDADNNNFRRDTPFTTESTTEVDFLPRAHGSNSADDCAAGDTQEVARGYTYDKVKKGNDEINPAGQWSIRSMRFGPVSFDRLMNQPFDKVIGGNTAFSLKVPSGYLARYCVNDRENAVDKEAKNADKASECSKRPVRAVVTSSGATLYEWAENDFRYFAPPDSIPVFEPVFEGDSPPEDSEPLSEIRLQEALKQIGV